MYKKKKNNGSTNPTNSMNQHSLIEAASSKSY